MENNNKEVFLLVNLVFKGVFKLMKSTGVVRKVDELGRIVIPIELRRTMDIEEKDALEVYGKRPQFEHFLTH